MTSESAPGQTPAPAVRDTATHSVTDTPVLVACSHGTDNLEGRAVIDRVVESVRALLPDVEVLQTFVDVQHPQLDEVLGSIDAGRPAVVVPVLLSGGFHVHVDVAEAVAARVSGGSPAVASTALGPDDRLAEILLQRLAEAGARAGDAVVVAAAGSSDARAAGDVEKVAAVVAQRWDGPVSVGYCSAAVPRVAVAADLARAGRGGGDHGRVVVASYLLAPGFFQDGLQRAAAEIITAPLGAHPILAEIVADRYRQGAAALAGDRGAVPVPAGDPAAG